ncbi:MAG: sulfatase-like hydrolase/transferase [Bacteroidales bacterium]|nr:sulfatase-like hydrolase/transferase [Bacteroidales bacterium]
MTDQQAGDAMSCRMSKIGKNYLNTPNMDRLCNEGVRFERAYCATPLSLPSRTSMLSGRYPHQTGVEDNSPDKASRERCRTFTTLGTTFQRAGYNTAYIGKFHTPYDPRKEFDHIANIRNNGADPRMLEPAAAFLEEQRNAEKPFFLVTSFNNPHNICEWARGDRGQQLPDGPIESPSLDVCPPLRSNHLPPRNETDIMKFMRKSYHATDMTPVGDFTEADWRKLQWAYYRMIEIVDRRIGKVLDALRRSGHEQNTLVVFLSDHGECQGAHRWNQKTVFFDESSRVPLAFHWPGVIEPGSREQLVQTGTDLFPTLCGLSDVTPPANLPGLDLTNIIMNNTHKKRDYIVTSTHFIQGEPVDGVKHTPYGRMVRSQQYKYCVYDEGKRREELYDMFNDPGEMENLAYKNEYNKIIQQHRNYLAEHCRKHNDSFRQV